MNILLLAFVVIVAYIEEGCCSGSGEFTLIILHQGDVRGKYDEYYPDNAFCNHARNESCIAGLSRSISVIKQMRENAARDNYEVIYLYSGGMFIGSVWHYLHTWHIASDFINVLKPEAMSVGYREFDDGYDAFKNFIEACNVPIISANMKFLNNPEITKIKPYHVLEIRGVKIGVIGHSLQVAYGHAVLPDIRFRNVVKTFQRYSIELRDAGVKLIISLGYSGYFRDARIAHEDPHVDIVITALTGEFFYNGEPESNDVPKYPYPKFIRNIHDGRMVPVASSYINGKYLGCLNVTLSKEGKLVSVTGNPIYMDEHKAKDPEGEKILSKYKDSVDKVINQKIADTKTHLYATVETCGRHECNMGNIIADALVEYATVNIPRQEGHWTETPVAIFNAGNLQCDINVVTDDHIHLGDLMQTMPFHDVIYKCRITGGALLAALEHGIGSNYSAYQRQMAFPQVSGVRLKYNPTYPVGSRLIRARVLCRRCSVPHYVLIVPEKNYTILINQILRAGGMHYDSLKMCMEQTAKLTLDAFNITRLYLEKMKIVYPEQGGRIIEAKNRYKSNDAIFKPSIKIIIVAILLVCIMYSVKLAY